MLYSALYFYFLFYLFNLKNYFLFYFLNNTNVHLSRPPDISYGFAPWQIFVALINTPEKRESIDIVAVQNCFRRKYTFLEIFKKGAVCENTKLQYDDR